MKNLIQNNSNADQSRTEVRKSQKHDANLQKNSTLYFQVGLILCLLGTFALLEMQFESKNYVPEKPELNEEIYEIAMSQVQEYKKEITKEKSVLKKQIIIDDVKPIKNDAPDQILETLITEPDPIPNQIIKADDIPVVTPVEEDFFIASVEFAPVYPGCEKYKKNSKRKKCFNDKIKKLVQKKFNAELASEYGLSGIQKINVQFKVNKKGEVTEIQTRAPHPKLGEEAERTINKIPKMIPGKMGDKPVNVIYTLPIKFKVEN
ncbi:energy transducer TonB [Winogradskyella immobilis]|uniref:Energy transducer TonB n=1 Tax=Winogradskyella immobilis TaxID=2816852 RepID=A0ABS8EIG9_9FLAO|nr:energy transducer TonB [Winogradskyella immobilis]MCC1483009.1 energy transducer TonB [Winogradskyella immobilis]MCG0015104.1 energy transducer TonB [Winogradskyella immobilis]